MSVDYEAKLAIIRIAESLDEISKSIQKVVNPEKKLKYVDDISCPKCHGMMKMRSDGIGVCGHCNHLVDNREPI